MQTADEFLTEAQVAAYGGPQEWDAAADPQFASPWGDAPSMGDTILKCHPDRPSEAVAWLHFKDFGRRRPGRSLKFRKPFVEDCLAGRVKGIEDPRQWLRKIMVGYYIGLGVRFD